MTILVTGATGNVGRPLTELLALDGAEVRAVTRNPQAAGLPAGVEVITTVSSLRGVTSLFLNPRAVGKAAGELLALAREQGVRRVVTLSAINVEDDPADQQGREPWSLLLRQHLCNRACSGEQDEQQSCK